MTGIILIIVGLGCWAVAIAAAADGPFDEDEIHVVRRAVWAALGIGAAMIGGGVWGVLA